MHWLSDYLEKTILNMYRSILSGYSTTMMSVSVTVSDYFLFLLMKLVWGVGRK